MSESKKTLFDTALEAEGVTGSLAELARSIYTQESGAGRNTKTSNRGAVGGMQILPDTFAGVADKDWSISDPLQNARAGIRYLKQMNQRAGGDPMLTAVGYYGGPGGIAKAKKGVAVSDPKNPQAPDTFGYAKQVVSRMKGGAPAQEEAAPVVAQAAPAPSVPPAQPTISEQLPIEVASSGPVGGAPPSGGGDPWLEFLARMPKAQAGVQVADLDFGRPISMGSRPGRGVSPNFNAFQPWRGRA